MNDFKVITVSREDLQKVLDAFPLIELGEYVHFAVELDSIEGDQVLWVDNGKFGDDRDYVIINEPHKNK